MVQVYIHRWDLARGALREVSKLMDFSKIHFQILHARWRRTTADSTGWCVATPEVHICVAPTTDRPLRRTVGCKEGVEKHEW